MDRFISSINPSLQTRKWYAALSMSLTGPDICGWLVDPKIGSQKRCEAWFDKYFLEKYKSQFHGEGFTFLTVSACYALRCAHFYE